MRLFGVIFNHCDMKKMKFLMQICIISPVFSPRISSLSHPSSTQLCSVLSSRLFCSQPDGFSDCFSICIDEIVEDAHNAAQSSAHCGKTPFLVQKVNFYILFAFQLFVYIFCKRNDYLECLDKKIVTTRSRSKSFLRRVRVVV